MRKTIAAGVLLMLTCFVLSCGGGAESSRRVVALLPFEYQGSDAAFQWLAPALTMAAAEQVRGVRAASVVLVNDANNAAQRSVKETLRGIVSATQGSIEISLYLEDVPSRTVKLLFSRRASNSGEALQALRAGLQDAGVAGSTFSTSNGEAFRRFGEALSVNEPATVEQHLRAALAVDPRFTGASLRLAASLAKRGEQPGAIGELERLLTTLPEDRALDRAYASLELALLRADRDGALDGLEQVVAASPGDTDARHRLAQVYTQARRYPEAAQHYLVLAGDDPGNGAYWNEAAYAQAYGEDRDGALRSLQRYREVAPEDANADDSHGDILYFFADFRAAAERYEAAYARDSKLNVGFAQLKAAWAWLQAGELARADEAANRYFGELRQNNLPLADLRAAQWQYMLGRRDEARSAAEAMRGQQGPAQASFASLLASQLYLWDAVEHGASALRFQAGPRYGGAVRPVVAALAQSLAPNVPSGERTTVITRLIPAQQQPAVIAVATFLAFEKETPFPPQALQMLQTTDAAVAESRATVTHALLARALARSGDDDAASKLFARRIPPVAEDDGLLWPLVFPRSLQWELESAERSGKAEDVTRLKDLVSKLSIPSDR